MNKFKYYILPILFLGLLLTSCEIEEVENPNSPTLESVEEGASLADLQLLLTGLESVLRNDMQFHYWTVSMVGREYWDLRNVDPRYTAELLGTSPLDNNGFLTTRSFAAAYSTVKQAEILMGAVNNSNASLSNAQIKGFMGFAKTLKAYAILLEANRQYENGMRLDTADPDNLGPFLAGYQATLTGIKALLDEAASDLSGAEFVFDLSAGFAGFDDAATFATFNRAIAARTAMYQGDKSLVLNELNASFLDTGADLNMGPAHVFGTTGSDLINPLFYAPDNSNATYIVHPSFIADATAGDSRVSNKTRLFADGPVTADGLSGDYQVALYSSNVDAVPIIRNEELILLYAESMIGSDNAAAVTALNIIRNAAGIGDYMGATDAASLEMELLHQRRYSLYGEGHRWIDMRRYNRLGDLPLDRAGDSVHEQFPRPVTEG